MTVADLLQVVPTRLIQAVRNFDKLRVGEVLISPVGDVRDLGSWLDTHMSMNLHISKNLQQGLSKPLPYQTNQEILN